MDQAKPKSGSNSPTLIFVVDDEPMLLDLAAAILQPLGYEVRTFRDPKMALAEFPAAKPSVIVTDYAMGEMNGMELVRECKRINPQQKILLLSGTVNENIYADSTAKPDMFLAKPYQLKDFIESVQKLATVKAVSDAALSLGKGGEYLGKETGKTAGDSVDKIKKGLGGLFGK